MTAFDSLEQIDLSLGIVPDSDSEPWQPHVDYWDHEGGAERLAQNLRESGYGDITADDFPGGSGLAWEEVTAIPHTGTHVDAPWHYGPESEGEPSKTIDELPTDWFCGEAVVLDFTWKDNGAEIQPHEIDEQLATIDHTLSAGEIVLIETGADELWGTSEYLTDFPGMGAKATKHLVDQGVKVIGIDAYGFDKPFETMGERYKETEDTSELWPAHLAGREAEYCQIEKMANFDELPQRTGIHLVTYPIKIENASAGWARPVAFV
ncbi:cyclase family protein [Natrarchaeobius halalkaliphilus]|uniref:Cyclase family protein n=1 Tax=Natrarchaeobius halalkaliphilus TaxID=1679091 RepID=A0A3N6P083_9EURY|nr:cyclase family protein [Natrarchaeobius halalkaliphilus]RQG87818.1 cyclase family protein [Natrarchaeobius halalkaliphilus]